MMSHVLTTTRLFSEQYSLVCFLFGASRCSSVLAPTTRFSSWQVSRPPSVQLLRF